MSPLASYLVQTIVTLSAIVILAGLVVFAARRFGVGRPAGPLQLVGRLPLDGRRAIYLVRVSDRLFVLGGSEAGLNKLGELEGQGLEFEREPVPAPAFRDVLERAFGKRKGSDDEGAA